MKNKSLRILAAAFGAAFVLAGAMPMNIEAASATVIDASNIRAEASSTSNAVGSAAAGSTITIGDAVTNDAGEQWYPVTLSDGTQGYIKASLVNVTDDSGTTDGGTAADQTETAGTAASGTDNAAADASSADGSTDGTQTDVTAAADTSADVPTAQAEGYAAAMTPTNATIASDVNIRSGAGTSYTKIGSLTAGTTLVVIGQAKDDAGDIWYQFYTTGTDQQMIGFARYDYVTLGDPVQTAASTDSTENAGTDATTAASADNGNNQYEAVYADDGTGTGNKTWYLYDYSTNTRKQISEMENAVTEANTTVTEANASLHKLKLLVLGLGVMLLACLIGIVALVLKLRRADAESGEIDLMKSRQRQELRRKEEERGRGREVEPHGQRRMEDRRAGTRTLDRPDADRNRSSDRADRDVRDVRQARPAAPRTGSEAYPTRRRMEDDRQSSRTMQQDRPVRRSQTPERDAGEVSEDVRRAGEAGRAVRSDVRRRPSVAGDEDVRTDRVRSTAGSRGTAPDEASRRRPQNAPVRNEEPADSAQNFADADDDDDDLQFLNMDN